MQQLHKGSREALEISPKLWAGIGLVRTGAGTALVGDPQTIAARIQDLYGVTGELRIAGHRIPLVIQILAPNHRPIQITQNLATFWKESYPKIKQELQRKYPKHEWR